MANNHPTDYGPKPSAASLQAEIFRLEGEIKRLRAEIRALKDKPNEATLFRIYLEMGYDTFCEFGGLSEEGKRLALQEWERRKQYQNCIKDKP